MMKNYRTPAHYSIFIILVLLFQDINFVNTLGMCLSYKCFGTDLVYINEAVGERFIAYKYGRYFSIVQNINIKVR